MKTSHVILAVTGLALMGGATYFVVKNRTKNTSLPANVAPSSIVKTPIVPVNPSLTPSLKLTTPIILTNPTIKTDSMSTTDLKVSNYLIPPSLKTTALAGYQNLLS
jgi:hypothetical protein